MTLSVNSKGEENQAATFDDTNIQTAYINNDVSGGEPKITAYTKQS